jgi:periplasmic divalent cation tolerance protein
MVLVYCPCPSLEQAKRIGKGLLDEGLAGCINILPGLISIYDWEGAREEASETVLIAKTSAAAAAGVRGYVEREHPYDLPAILTLPLASVNERYSDWLLARISPVA